MTDLKLKKSKQDDNDFLHSMVASYMIPTLAFYPYIIHVTTQTVIPN